MSAPVTLLMAMHCHQPVGNFGFVFDEAYAKAYEPFLAVLERHPGVRLALHYSGCLLDWLLERRPAFLGRLQRLVKRGQVELLASGYYEPILPLIPEPDRQGQIAAMRAALWRHCRTDARGLWLTERVWEPDLPASLARAGIRYTMVDTNQFLTAKRWLPRELQAQDDSFWDLFGSYTTEYAGESVTLFPASKRLRYWMPFQAVERTIEFLRRLRRDVPVAITVADDGEKFGLWPKTHHWVYEEGWLDQFFTAIEREREWLATSTFHDYARGTSPDGRVYLPCGSYEEMLEWSDGHFRNFFSKYPEANAMQQKMLRVSRQVESLSSVERRPSKGQARSTSGRRRSKLLKQARQELYTGQCNCAYWHGVFGGLYLFHLRRAVYARLIAAEALADQVVPAPQAMRLDDVDGDGRDEGCLKSRAMGVVVDPQDGGAITEWSLYGPGINLLDTLSRRKEPYHDKLRAASRDQAGHPAGGGVGDGSVEGRSPSTDQAGHPAGGGVGGVSSIHDALGVKEQNLASYVIYDDHRRSAFLDYALERMPALEDVVRSTWAEHRLWSGGTFHWEPPPRPARGWSPTGTARGTNDDAQRGATSRPPVRHGTPEGYTAAGRGPMAGTSRPPSLAMARMDSGGRIRKTVRLHQTRPILECLYALDGVRAPVVALEFNLSLRDPRYLDRAGQQEDVGQFRLDEPEAGVSVSLAIDPPATVFHFPIETVSESEEGMERTYQGLCLICFWKVSSRSWTSRLEWTVS